MKKLTYLVIATAALGMVACTGGNKAGYVVTGTVEGASDGDTVYLQEATLVLTDCFVELPSCSSDSVLR